MRRTPLTRRTALKATKGLTRGTKRLNPVSAKKQAQEPDRDEVRAAVFERDRGCRIRPLLVAIDHRDARCFGKMTVHHLRKASARGDYTMENLIAACAFHNDWVEDHPRLARSLGLVIR